jgi:hypothetical protein
MTSHPDFPSLQDVYFVVERSKLEELARAWFDRGPAEAVAESGPFETIPVPLLAGVLINHYLAGGAESVVSDLGLDLERSVHGEMIWEYLRPLPIGRVIRAVRRVSEVAKRQGRRGGELTIVTVDVEYRDENDVLLVVRRDLYIERES